MGTTHTYILGILQSEASILLEHKLQHRAVKTLIPFQPLAGALVAYVNVLADVLSSVAGSVIPPGAEPSRNVLMAAVTCFGAFPMALYVRSPQVWTLAPNPSLLPELGLLIR